MKVQRCPSCRAGYSVERLEAGATFECRCCHATVEVAPTESVGASASIGLLMAGLLALVALVLYANPRFGVVRSWPWEYFQTAGSLAVQVNLALWALLGIWAVVTALVPGFEGRSLLTLALGILALLLACAPEAYGLGIDLPRTVPWMVGGTALAAGFVLVLEDRFGLATRLLLLGGSVVLVWLVVGRFEQDTSHFAWLVRDVKELFQGTLPADKTGAHYLWLTLAPELGVLLAAALATILGLGLRVRPLAWVGGLVLVAAMVLPGAVRIGTGLEGQAFSLGVLGLSFLDGLGAALIEGGVALWLILSLATTDLVRTREVPS